MEKNGKLQLNDIVVFERNSMGGVDPVAMCFIRDGKQLKTPELLRLNLDLSHDAILLPDEISRENIKIFIVALLSDTLGFKLRPLPSPEFSMHGLNNWLKIEAAYILE